jgi:uncharacterized repeat protein (TIGR04052 family)
MCPGDLDGDGQVTADEVVTAVGKSLEGCDLLEVNLRFRAQVGDEPFACGQTYDGVGTSNSTWLPADLRFYIHGLRLVRADRSEVPVRLTQDGPWQNGDTALLDFEDRTPPCNNGTSVVNDIVRGLAPPGEYTGVRFVLGVPFDENHQDASAAASPLNQTSMFWGWRGGYKFLRVDSFVVLDGEFPEFRIHLGSTGCRYGRPLEVAGCVWPNRADVLLNDFDLERDVVVADLAAVLADSDLLSNVPETAPGCMSDFGDTDCEPVFRNLGIDFDDGYPTPNTQRFFRVEAAAAE